MVLAAAVAGYRENLLLCAHKFRKNGLIALPVAFLHMRSMMSRRDACDPRAMIHT